MGDKIQDVLSTEADAGRLQMTIETIKALRTKIQRLKLDTRDTWGGSKELWSVTPPPPPHSKAPPVAILEFNVLSFFAVSSSQHMQWPVSAAAIGSGHVSAWLREKAKEG